VAGFCQRQRHNHAAGRRRWTAPSHSRGSYGRGKIGCHFARWPSAGDGRGTSLCSALVSEGRVIYGHMIGACRLHDEVVDKEHHRLRQPRAEPVHADRPSSLHNWWIPRWARHLLPSNLFADRDTNAHGVRLLIENLSQVQRDQYERRGHFEVTGEEPASAIGSENPTK
jgi:hypothetical protein